LKRALQTREKIYLSLFSSFPPSPFSLSLSPLPGSPLPFLSPSLPSFNNLKPKILWNLIFAAVTGVLLGLGLAFLADYMDHTIKTVDDIDAYLNQPMIISLPELKRGEMRQGK
jgi:hypothetical protein